MSRVAEDCVLKLEVKLFLSRQKLWADALRESEKLLVSVQSRKGPTHEELDRIKHLMSIEAGAARRRPSHDRESLREAPAKSYSGPHADWRSFPPQSSHSSHSRYHYNSQVRMNQVVGLREKPHPVRVPLEHELRNCNVYGIQSHIRNGSYPSGSRVGRGSIYVRAQRGEDPFRDSPSVRSNGGHSPPSRNPDHAYQYTGYDYRSPERYGTNGDRDDEEFGSTKRHRSEIDSNVSSDQIDMNLFRAAGGNRKSVSPSNNRSVYSDSKRKYAFGSYENRF